MTHSMTAFTCHDAQYPWGRMTWELRTVNHRFLELDLNLPELFRELEPKLRACLARYVFRGRVEACLTYKPTPQGQHLAVNFEILNQLIEVSQSIAPHWTGSLQTALPELLQWPGLLEVQVTHKKEQLADAYQLFEQGLEAICAQRAREGAALEQKIHERLQGLSGVVNQIKQRLPIARQESRQKILNRIADLQVALDPQRLETELLSLIQKMDISEEVDRLEIHARAVEDTLRQTGSIGRKLDFLMQELHREANTLGAKSAGLSMTHAAIELKVLIEQMREQIQNLE